MNKSFITAASLGALLISGCATSPVNPIGTFQAKDLNELLSSGQYQQKTDNFFVINDSSSSMGEDYKGPAFASGETPIKLAVEKEILSRMNQTIPDLKLSAGIRSFGFGPCTGWGSTLLNMPPAAYTKSTFSAGIDSLTCASGGSPMNEAIEAAASDLASTSGQIAVLILSDGHELDGDPVPAVQALKQQYGERLCVYSVWVGNKHEESGKLLLNSLSDIAGCGYRAEAENVATPDGMAELVKSVFLKPATAAPVADCSTKDGDGDGVNDCNDKCPDTPKGARVDETGCWVYHGVLFDTDKATIKPEFIPALDNAVEVMELNPGLRVRIEGHTDSRASAAHNQKLSERRAEAVKKYLVDHNVDASRLETIGYGESQPVDTNETEEGRYYNRRVKFERANR